jgi:glucose-6-phosphate-specific signal transduction histidine kinase
VTGEPPALTPGIDLAAYRILEDSLVSAQRHAATEASVLVRYGSDQIELRIEDDGADDVPPGVVEVDEGAEVGMSERVAIYGGRIQRGRRGDGRYGARVVLPTAAVPA